MRYVSLFSGIEAATHAWDPMDFVPVAFAEIEPAPCQVLAHHYPHVPNLGDVTQLTEDQAAALGPVDILVFGSPCFTAGHTVLTERGLIPIESVVVGDMVWTHASRWKRVSNTMTRIAPTVVVNGQGHNAIRATPDHPFYATDTIRTWNGNGYTRNLAAPDWVHATDMLGKRWAAPINLTCDTETPEGLCSLDAAYLAGLYLGDGHIGRTTGRNKKSVILSVGFAKRDKILPKLRESWGTVGCFAHGTSVVRLQLSRTHLADALIANFGELSHLKHIPVWALCASAEWQAAFLQGVLDTDGSAKVNGFRVTTTSRALAVGLRLLVARLGHSSSLNFSERPKTCVIEGRTVNQRDTWTVTLRTGKRTSELRTDEHTWGLVRSVTPSDDAQVYDITVEDDHSFICDGIVVHNCQDLSVAGKRKGLDGERSGLFFTAMRIAGWLRKHNGLRWAIWENVPGAFSSNAGRDFATVVDLMAGLDGTEPPTKGWGTEGIAAGQEAMVEWATLDAQWFGVAQRRRRVFAVADFGDWRGRPPILLEPESLRGDTAPSRETGQSVAGTLTASTGGCDENDAEGDRLVPMTFGGGNQSRPINVSTCLTAKAGGRMDFDSETFAVAFDTTQVTSKANRSNPKPGDPCHPLAAGMHPPAIAFHPTQDPISSDEGTTHALGCGSTGGQASVAVAVALRGREGGATAELGDEVQNHLRASSGGGDKPHVLTNMQVRRLTPRECERLQGFRDDFTLVPNKMNKPMADGPRYKALGNSMAVPVMAWIGHRIQFAHTFF